MTPDQLRNILKRFAQQKIVVVGDVMLDHFLWGKVSRISPEAPVPVVEITRESYFPGGAANVARNHPSRLHVREISLRLLQMACALRRAGFDIVGLANNHALDYGRSALGDTIQQCRQMDLRHMRVGHHRHHAFGQGF